jgi:hypothetical protein
MELFIRIKDGQPFEHPVFGDNFREAFPDVDVDNLPPEFARFERVEAPRITPYQKNLRVQYELGSDGIYRDVWYKDQLTAEEITEKQDAAKAAWAADENTPKSWVFDEETCWFKPPVEYPSVEGPYVWDEDSLSWVEVSPETGVA